MLFRLVMMIRWISWTILLLAGSGCASRSNPDEYIPIVTLDQVTSDSNGITLTWSYVPITISPDIAPHRYSSFKLDRAEDPSGPWKTIAPNLPCPTESYTDRDVDPGSQYHYRLTSYLEDGRSTSVSMVEPVAGPPRFSFQFEHPTGPNGLVPGMVVVLISKFEKRIGKVEIRHVQYVDEPLGWWEESPGEKPTSRHQVTLEGGRTAVIDFNTRAELTAVIPILFTMAIPKCTPITDSRDGSWIGCKRTVETTQVATYQISYRDQKGWHDTMVPWPVAKELRCDRHRENNNEPPRNRRLFEARVLLDEADRLWNSDSEASINAYQSLLKNYGDIVIELHVHNRVQKRAAQADD